MSDKDSLERLLGIIVDASEEIRSNGKYSDFIRLVDGFEDVSAGEYDQDPKKPFEYLKNWEDGWWWNAYLDNILDQYHRGVISTQRMHALVGRLKVPARQLDRHVPNLSRHYEQQPNMPREIMSHAREMQTSVNSFLIAVETWLPSAERAYDLAGNQIQGMLASRYPW